MQDAEVEITARLARAEGVAQRRSLNMKRGDIIGLDIKPTLVTEVDGVPIFECRYGVLDGKYAIKVEKIPPFPNVKTPWGTTMSDQTSNASAEGSTGPQRWPNRRPIPARRRMPPGRGGDRTACHRHVPGIHARRIRRPRNDIDMIMDIPVQLTVELGRTKIPIKHILQLAQGSVVELDGLAGEPMNVLINGCLIAQGEVVVVNEKFGIRLTDIITPSERIRKLNK